MILGDTQRERAQRLLHFMLPATTTALQAAAVAERISWPTVNRAAADLGVVKVRQRVGAWVWRFADQPDPEPGNADAYLTELLRAAMREREDAMREREDAMRESHAEPPGDATVDTGARDAPPTDAADADPGYTHPADEPDIPREGMLAGPGVALAEGERTAQCSRCGLAVVTATPPDTLPRCRSCKAAPRPRVRPEPPCDSGEPRSLADAWRQDPPGWP